MRGKLVAALAGAVVAAISAPLGGASLPDRQAAKELHAPAGTAENGGGGVLDGNEPAALPPRSSLPETAAVHAGSHEQESLPAPAPQQGTSPPRAAAPQQQASRRPAAILSMAGDTATQHARTPPRPPTSSPLEPPHTLDRRLRLAAEALQSGAITTALTALDDHAQRFPAAPTAERDQLAREAQARAAPRGR